MTWRSAFVAAFALVGCVTGCAGNGSDGLRNASSSVTAQAGGEAPSGQSDKNGQINNAANGLDNMLSGSDVVETGDPSLSHVAHSVPAVSNSEPVKRPVVHKHLVPEIAQVPYGSVALTIDDGPTEYTQGILDVLDKYHVKVTFFFVGNRVQMFPGAVQAAVKQGDVIGDHTADHGNLDTMTAQQQNWEILTGAHEIQTVDPQSVTLFRPPYEAFDDDTETVLAQDHLALALWNRDPLDWAAKTPEDIVHSVLSDSPSGGVFDLHDTRLTLLALPKIIEGLEQQHLNLVVLSAPAASTGISPNQK